MEMPLNKSPRINQSVWISIISAIVGGIVTIITTYIKIIPEIKEKHDSEISVVNHTKDSLTHQVKSLVDQLKQKCTIKGKVTSRSNSQINDVDLYFANSDYQTNPSVNGEFELPSVSDNASYWLIVVDKNKTENLLLDRDKTSTESKRFLISYQIKKN
jgi:hypothetical protein